jgi:hypothetical protein
MRTELGMPYLGNYAKIRTGRSTLGSSSRQRKRNGKIVLFYLCQSSANL